MSDKITAIENSDLFTDLSLDEEESLCGGGVKSFFSKAWKKVKEVAEEVVVPIVVAVVTTAINKKID